MKTKTIASFFAGVFAVLILAGIASAASLELALVSAPTNVASSSDITITFNVSDKGTSNYTALNWSGSTTNIGSWKTLPSRTSINVGETYTLSAVLTIPAGASGTINPLIDLQSETTAQAQLAVPPITINNTPSILISDASISTNSNTANIVISNNGNSVLNNIVINSTGDFAVLLSKSTITSLSPGSSETITVTINQDTSKLVGPKSVQITAYSGNISDSGIVSYSGNYCEYSNNGNLDLTIDDINVEKGFGDEKEWFPLDEINIDLLVENNGNDNIKNIRVEWGIYDSKLGKWYLKGKESSFKLNDGDDKTVTINFRLDKNVDDLENGDYVFYAKATGEDEEFDSNKTCSSDSTSVEMIIESDFVVLDNIQQPETASCGTETVITAEVWNIGDQDQDNVLVKISNKELGIDEKITIDEIQSFEKSDIEMKINLPSSIKSGTYILKLEVFDEDGDVYENDYDDDKATYNLPIVAEGGACAGSNKASVSASLDSDAIAGQDLIVKATITNLDKTASTLTIQAEDYTSWATLDNQDKNTLVLEAGKSGEVTFTFNVDKDVSGDQTFKIVTTTADGSTITQPMRISIEGADGFSFGNITGNIISDGNWFIWGIGILNVILVVAIILVVIKLRK